MEDLKMWNNTERALGKATIRVDGNDVQIRAKVGDVTTYLKTAQKYKTKPDEERLDFLDYQMEFITKLISQANPTVDIEEIKLMVEMNVEEFTKSTLIALKLAKPDSFKELDKTKN